MRAPVASVVLGFLCVFLVACGSPVDNSISKLKSARSKLDAAATGGDMNAYADGVEAFASAWESMVDLKGTSVSDADKVRIATELAQTQQSMVKCMGMMDSAMAKLDSETQKRIGERQAAALTRIGAATMKANQK